MPEELSDFAHLSRWSARFRLAKSFKALDLGDHYSSSDVQYRNNVVSKDSQENFGTHIGTKGKKAKVNDLAFSSDGKMFASAGDDGSIRLWELGKGQRQDGQLLSGHDKPVMSVSFSPNGKLLASGSKDKTVRIWQLS